MIKKLLPKNKSEWIILSGFLLSFIADVVHSNYSFDPMNATPRVALIEWLIRVVRDWALTAALATMIIAGIRLIRKDGFTLKRLLFPVIGFVIAGGCLWVSLFGYQRFSALQEMDRTRNISRNKFETTINLKNLPPDKKSKTSKFIAYMRFHEDGVLVNYFTPDGKVELYTPTEKEKKERDEFLKTNKLINWMTRSLYISVYFWVVVIVVSFALGFLTPVKRKTPNNGVDSDATNPTSQVTP